MTRERTLLAEIAAHPGDPAPCNVYADWLEEHGQTDKAACLRAAVLQRTAIEQLRSVQRVAPDWLPSVLGPTAPRTYVALLEHGKDREDEDNVSMAFIPTAGLDETLRQHLRTVLDFFQSDYRWRTEVIDALEGGEAPPYLTDEIMRSMAFLDAAIGLPVCTAELPCAPHLRAPADVAERYQTLREGVVWEYSFGDPPPGPFVVTELHYLRYSKQG